MKERASERHKHEVSAGMNIALSVIRQGRKEGRKCTVNEREGRWRSERGCWDQMPLLLGIRLESRMTLCDTTNGQSVRVDGRTRDQEASLCGEMRNARDELTDAPGLRRE